MPPEKPISFGCVAVTLFFNAVGFGQDRRMNKYSHMWALGFVMLAIAALGPASARAEIKELPRYIDVINHKGGNVIETVQLRNKLSRSGKQVRIRGYCRSACTILITMPNACLGPQATVGFHAPRIPNTQIIPPYVDQIMGSYYRNGIRDRWFGGWNRSHDMAVITAGTFVRLDPQTPICKSIKAPVK